MPQGKQFDFCGIGDGIALVLSFRAFENTGATVGGIKTVLVRESTAIEGAKRDWQKNPLWEGRDLRSFYSRESLFGKRKVKRERLTPLRGLFYRLCIVVFSG